VIGALISVASGRQDRVSEFAKRAIRRIAALDVGS
jgi:hypothetical protein